MLIAESRVGLAAHNKQLKLSFISDIQILQSHIPLCKSGDGVRQVVPIEVLAIVHGTVSRARLYGVVKIVNVGNVGGG